jgi:hypothetical protein
MQQSDQILNAYYNFRLNSKNQIYKIIQGRDGFDTAVKMLNWDDQKLWDKQWESQWSDYEKDNALFILFKRKIRVKSKIGIKLFIGTGDTFSGVGEIHEEKVALKIWKTYLN